MLTVPTHQSDVAELTLTGVPKLPPPSSERTILVSTNECAAPMRRSRPPIGMWQFGPSGSDFSWLSEYTTFTEPSGLTVTTGQNRLTPVEGTGPATGRGALHVAPPSSEKLSKTLADFRF